MNARTLFCLTLPLMGLTGFIGCNRGGNPEAANFRAASVVSAASPAPHEMQSYADVVDRVAPAVVTVRSAKRARPAQQFPFLLEPFMRERQGDPSRRAPQGGRGPVQRGLGSGVIISADGYIVTNHHVIDGADEIKVDMINRQTYSAKLVGSDAPSDLAVLKIEANRLPLLSLADSDKVRVGDICLAVGNPLGIGETVTAGIVSAKGRYTGLSDGSFEDFLQTDASINQGNSGGALVNTRGELIGINSQILSPTGGNIGIGFAIPSNMTRTVVDQLTKTGKVRRGMLGVGIQLITSELASSLGLTDVRGVLVNSVEPGSPAEIAGLRTGDIISTVNGTPTNHPNTLRNRVASTPPGSEITLGILRDGKEQQLKARVKELDAKDKAPASSGEGQSNGRGGQLGISVEPLTPEMASRMGLKSGTQGLLVTSVDPNGPAAEAGIQAEDVLLEVNRTPVKSVTDVKAALGKSASRPALLLVNRGGRSVFLTVKPQG
ncbi:MAG TPA: DegQ family serine endoprotease [Bryobacteraceae bacterium]|nr:DegQ family serine endoprotease [Bryobacteraceae bacterium]